MNVAVVDDLPADGAAQPPLFPTRKPELCWRKNDCSQQTTSATRKRPHGTWSLTERLWRCWVIIMVRPAWKLAQLATGVVYDVHERRGLMTHEQQRVILSIRCSVVRVSACGRKTK